MGRVMMVVRPSKGGAFGHVARLGRSLTERGHSVFVVGPHAAHESTLGFPVVNVEMGRAIEPRTDAGALRQIAAAYREVQPDLIHAHGSKGGVLARLARYGARSTPLVLTPHNYAFTNWFSSRPERLAYRAIETSLSPLSTMTLCVCETEGEIARTVGPDARIRVVHNGTAPLPETPAGELPERLAAAGPLVLAVTEFSPPKGVPTLVDAMTKVARESPAANLVIAGDGPLRPEVEERIRRAGVGERVHLLGQVSTVPGLLRLADVVVSPSWSESFPYAILEAMSASAAIVATDVGGVGEAVEHDLTGRLVPAHDADALAREIAALLGDEAKREALGAAALERWEERFTFDRMVEGTLDAYGELGFS